MNPYWQSPDGAITVFHARMEDVLAAGVVDVPRVKLVHADPPYGVAMAHDRAKRRRGEVRGSRLNGGALKARNFGPVAGDDEPYEPSPLLALGRPAVLWGANHYAPRVPGSPSWLLWDKRREAGSDDGADGELAWSNLGGPLRVFRHLWRGTCRDSEVGVPHLHPTQKPVALCAWVYQRAKLAPGDLVFVPYLGSGPDLPAARAAGLRVVACDVEQWCCDTAIARLGAVTAERAAEPVGPLFGGRL